jgi:hypothetical protein
MSTPILVSAAVAASLLAFAPTLRFAYGAPGPASYLVLGRFLRERDLDSLMLVAALETPGDRPTTPGCAGLWIVRCHSPAARAPCTA